MSACLHGMEGGHRVAPTLVYTPRNRQSSTVSKKLSQHLYTFLEKDTVKYSLQETVTTLIYIPGKRHSQVQSPRNCHNTYIHSWKKTQPSTVSKKLSQHLYTLLEQDTVTYRLQETVTTLIYIPGKRHSHVQSPRNCHNTYIHSWKKTQSSTVSKKLSQHLYTFLEKDTVKYSLQETVTTLIYTPRTRHSQVQSPRNCHNTYIHSWKKTQSRTVSKKLSQHLHTFLEKDTVKYSLQETVTTLIYIPGKRHSQVQSPRNCHNTYIHSWKKTQSSTVSKKLSQHLYTFLEKDTVKYSLQETVTTLIYIPGKRHSQVQSPRNCHNTYIHSWKKTQSSTVSKKLSQHLYTFLEKDTVKYSLQETVTTLIYTPRTRHSHVQTPRNCHNTYIHSWKKTQSSTVSKKLSQHLYTFLEKDTVKYSLQETVTTLIYIPGKRHSQVQSPRNYHNTYIHS